MSDFGRRGAAWAILLVAGFAVIFALGGPLPTEQDALAAAMHPTPPVSQEAAIASADAIVHLRYGQFAGASRSVERRTDFGIDHWVIVYADQAGPSISGLNISIGVTTGIVEVSTFP